MTIKGAKISARKEQIDWLVGFYFDNEPNSWAASNLEIERAFERHFKVGLTSRLWKDRIKAAANQIGLSGRLNHYPSSLPMTWAGRREVVYS